MSRGVDTVISQFRRMGYTVFEDGDDVRVVLETQGRYTCGVKVPIIELYGNHIVEEIVYLLNGHIKRDL